MSRVKFDIYPTNIGGFTLGFEFSVNKYRLMLHFTFALWAGYLCIPWRRS